MSEYSLKFEFKEDCFIIENDGSSVWAYLVDLRAGKILKDVFLFSPIPTEDVLDRSHIKQGNPPKLVKEFASEIAYMPDIPESELSVISSGKGDYCVFIGKQPFAAIYNNKMRGYSKSLCKSGGFGMPWCNNNYVQVFKSGS